MDRALRLLLTLVLLGLQGIAPLLHAHAGGEGLRTGVHMHGVQADDAGGPIHQSHVQQDQWHADEAPAIGVGTAARETPWGADLPALVQRMRPTQPAMAEFRPFSIHYQSLRPFSRGSPTPPPQAPPQPA